MTVISSEQASGGRFIENVYASEKWAWKDRAFKWARWTRPIAAASTEHPARDLAANMLIHPVECEAEASTAISSGWSTSLRIHTAAVFGHVLHRQSATSAAYSDLHALQSCNPHHHRILDPVIPPFRTLGFPQVLPQPASGPLDIFIRLIPDPAQPRSLTSLAPSLVLRLAAQDADEVVSTLVSLWAVPNGGQTVRDVLIPSGPVDIRVTQTQFFEQRLDGALDDPALADFLAKSELHLSHGQLVTPARLRGFTVPRHMLTPVHDQHGEGAIPVDYLFAGLEVRRAVAAAFDGWRLVYTSIEAGQGGGRRAELCLEAVPVATTLPQENNTMASAIDTVVYDTQAYIATLSKIALEKDFPWYMDRR
jgi:hypothetical protein